MAFINFFFFSLQGIYISVLTKHKLTPWQSAQLIRALQYASIAGSIPSQDI